MVGLVVRAGCVRLCVGVLQREGNAGSGSGSGSRHGASG